jgi:Branched-chain amino acid transport protein (AzlD)
VIWAAVLTGALACYLLKLAGLAVPARVLDDARVRRVSVVLPIALLAALAVTQTFTTAGRLTVDARAAGLAVAVGALLLRAPFLLVVGAAAATTAALRLL